MTIPDTNPIELPIKNGGDYLLTVSGGNLTVTYKSEAGTDEAVIGSPFTAGSQKLVCLSSADGKITIVGDTPGMDAQIVKYLG